jgi:ABC-type Mn2+/Zn2+ transport system permease subunit
MTAVTSGYLLYLVVAALLVLFWRHLRGLSFDALLARATEEHHHVHRVLAKHPHGGTWQAYRDWMQAET